MPKDDAKSATNDAELATNDDAEPNDDTIPAADVPSPKQPRNLGEHSAGKPKVLKKYKNGAIYANIQGLYPKTNKSKIPYLQDLASLTNAPFIMLTETHLNSDVLDS